MKLCQEKSVLIMGRNSDVRQIMNQHQIVGYPFLFPFRRLTELLGGKTD